MNKTWWSNAVWVMLFLFLLPSSLAVASWNSLPGSRLFNVKLVGEQALVAIIPSQEAKGSLQIAYTERRLEDATKIIEDDSSGRGLAYLDTQVNTTRQTIVTTSDRNVKRQLSQKYIGTLQDANAKLEERKQLAQRAQPQTIIQQTVVVNQIIQTQQNITQTIQQVQAETPPPEPTPTPTPTDTPIPTPTPLPSPTPAAESNGIGAASAPPPTDTTTVGVADQPAAQIQVGAKIPTNTPTPTPKPRRHKSSD